MNFTEGLSIKYTPAPIKDRKVLGYWNWPGFAELAQKCLDTGEEQKMEYQQWLVVAKPGYGVVESALTEEYKAAHEPVRIILYGWTFSLHAEKGAAIPPKWLKKEELLESGK